MTINEYDEINFQIESHEELEDLAADYIEVYEDPPETAKGLSDDEIARMFNDGAMEEGEAYLDTKELFIEIKEESCDFIPVKASTNVQFSDWFEGVVEGKVSPRALGMKPIAHMTVYLNLEKVWRNKDGRLLAKYILEEGEVGV